MSRQKRPEVSQQADTGGEEQVREGGEQGGRGGVVL